MIHMTKFRIALFAALLGGFVLHGYAQEVPTPPPSPAPPAVLSETSKSSYLGVMVSDVTPDRVSALKLKEERGCEITVVDHDGPAFKAGLKEHDVILQFNDSRLESVEELRRLIRETPPGRKVTLGIMRNGQPMNVDVTLGTRTEASVWQYRIPKMRIVPMPPMHVVTPNVYMFYGSRAGLQVESLTDQLAGYFGVKDGNGLLVRSVDDDSPAHSAGFKAGDVIIKAGDTKINDQGDWRNTLRDYRGKKLPVTILRDKREQTLTLDVPGRESSENSLEIDVPDFDETQVIALEKDLQTLGSETYQVSVTELQKHQVEAQRALREAQRRLQRELERMQRELRQRELERQHEEHNDQTQP